MEGRLPPAVDSSDLSGRGWHAHPNRKPLPGTKLAPEPATPPGTTRPNELEASWEVMTGPQRSLRTEIFWIAHMQA